MSVVPLYGNREKIIARIKSNPVLDRDHGVAIILVFFIFLFLISNDFGIFSGWSFYSGSIFANSQMTILRFPAQSKLGLAFTAAFSAAFEGTMYFITSLLILNPSWLIIFKKSKKEREQ